MLWDFFVGPSELLRVPYNISEIQLNIHILAGHVTAIHVNVTVDYYQVMLTSHIMYRCDLGLLQSVPRVCGCLQVR